jgi:hypothetical protein
MLLLRVVARVIADFSELCAARRCVAAAAGSSAALGGRATGLRAAAALHSGAGLLACELQLSAERFRL